MVNGYAIRLLSTIDRITIFVDKNNAMNRPGYIHMVYFWLRDDVSEAQRSNFHQGVADLTKCKTILDAFIGPPAMTPRDVVDNSYDYALLVFFKNKSDHDAYQNDPDHHKFIQDHKDIWARVQVYDHLPVQ